MLFAIPLTMNERVAIPLWLGRISPVFDTAARIYIVEFDQARHVVRKSIEMLPGGFNNRIKLFSNRHIDTILCGAISRNMKNRLNWVGICVRSNLSGEAIELIKSYAQGPDNLGGFLQPGRRRTRSRKHSRKGRSANTRFNNSTREDT